MNYRKFYHIPYILFFMLAACAAPKDIVYQDVKNIRVQSLDLSHPTVALDLQFYNPNPYSMKVKQASVEVFMNDHHLGKIFMDTTIAIPKAGTFLVPVSLVVDAVGTLPNAMQLLLNKQINVKLDGYMKAKRRGLYLTIPIHYEGKQQINIF